MNRTSITEKLKKRLGSVTHCLIISIFLLATFLCGCGGAKLNLYEAGIEVTSTMEALLKDEAYVDSALGIGSGNVKDYIASDYDSPIKVYSISKHDADKFEKLLVKESQEFSDAAKEQIRFYAESFEYALNVIKLNNAKDVVEFGFSASKVYKNCVLEEEVAYLYVFETGKPILVRFEETKGGVYANGFFLRVDATLSSLRDLFEPYGCKVEIIKGDFKGE